VVTVVDPCGSSSLVTINTATFSSFSSTYNLNFVEDIHSWTSTNQGSSSKTEA